MGIDDQNKAILLQLKNFSKLYTNLNPEWFGKKKLCLTKKTKLFVQGINNFDKTICEILKIKALPKENFENIVQGTIYNSYNDHQNKLKDKNYYIQNAVAFKFVAGKIVKLIQDKRNASKLFTSNFSSILNQLVFDSMLLLQQAAKFQKFNVPNNVYKNEQHQVYNMLGALNVLLYGQDGSQFTIPNVPEASLGIIRIALENRIRSAVGCYGIVDQNNNIGPLNLTDIFVELGKYKKYIDFSVKLENIIRIYKWTNIYVHSGEISYFWCPYIIHEYLAPLFLGKSTDFSIWAGIKIPERIVYKIWKELEEKITRKRWYDKLLFRKNNGKYLYKVRDIKSLNAIITPPCS